MKSMKRFLVLMALLGVVGFTSMSIMASNVPEGVGTGDQHFDGWSQAERDTMREAMRDAYRDFAATGFDLGQPARNATLWEGVVLQDFVSPDSTGSDPWHGFSLGIVYNPTLEEAFIVRDAFFSAYTFNHASLPNLGVMGPAIGNDFEIDNFRYQNFANGYYRIDLDGNVNPYFGGGVHFDAALGEEVPLEGLPANIGNVSSVMTLPAGLTASDIEAAFVSAYVEQTQAGNHLGFPYTSVKIWEGVYVQDFADSDSSVSPWGDGRDSVLALNSITGRVHRVRDAFFLVYAGTTIGEDQSIDISDLGEPRGDDFAIADAMVQNFEKGYVHIEDGVITFTPDLNIDQDGNTYELFGAELIGLISLIAERSLPEGFDSEDVLNGFTEAYQALDDEELMPTGLVEVRPGYVHQHYRDETNDNELVVFLRFDGETLILEGDMLDAFNRLPGTGYDISGHRVLGAPMSEAIERDTHRYQQFEYGYMVLDEEGSIVDLRIGFEFDENFEEVPRSFADKITMSPTFTAPLNYVDQDGNVLDEAFYLELFTNAYNDLFESGFHPGVPMDEGINIWSPGMSNGELHVGMLKLSLQGGDSTGFVFNSNAKLTFNPETLEIFLVHDVILSSFQTIYYQSGYATGEMVEAQDGWFVQQFSEGYVQTSADGESYRFFEGRTFGETDDVDDDKNDEESTDESPTLWLVIGSITLGVVALSGVGAMIVIKNKK